MGISPCIGKEVFSYAVVFFHRELDAGEQMH